MNLDELKPVWKTFQDQVDRQDHWSKAQLSELLKPHITPPYRRSSRVMLNLCMCVLLIGINGC